MIRKMMALILCLQFSTAYAEEAVSEKTSIKAEKIENSIKKTYRKVDDKVCELLNGKMKCVAKKIKHTIQNASDDVSTTAKELKDKVENHEQTK